MTPTFPPRGEWLALVAALILFGLTLGLGACGSEDLVFPGEIPNTPTSAPTATSTPT